MSALKELLTAVITAEAERLGRKARDGMLTDEDVARIPALAMAAERVEKLRAGDVLDDRDAAELEAATHGS